MNPPNPTSKRSGAKMAQGKTEPAKLSDIHSTLKRIEARLVFINERDNLNSFALAAPMTDRPIFHPGTQSPRSPLGTGVTAAPQPASAFQRIDACENRETELDVRISQLYGRLSDVERALFGEGRG